MSRSNPAVTPASFNAFGELLRYLRRRAYLTQRDLGIATGYSEAQISRLELNQRLPDPTALVALFVPALDLDHQPDWVARLLELAAAARGESTPNEGTEHDQAGQPPLADLSGGLEAIPPPAPYEVARPHVLALLRARLAAERRVALCGLAGMGKTTLAAALAREMASTSPVFWLTLTAGVTTSVDVLIYQLALFLRDQGQGQVATLLRPTTDPKTALPLSQQVTLLGASLTRLANHSPALPLLCFDNIDLAQHDEAVIQLLRHLMAATPAAMLLMSRENAPLPGMARVRLAGLERDEGLALIRQLLVEPAQPSHRPVAHAGQVSAAWSSVQFERLLAKTGGNPMLLRLALGQWLDQPEATDPAAFITHLETHPQVSTYLLETVQRQLTPAAWRLLSLAAVFRQPVNLYDERLIELNQTTDGPADFSVALTELQRHYLIDHPAQANLHPLVRDYVYAVLTADPPRRRRLHAIAAEWLEQTLGQTVEAAYHYLRAGQLEAVGDALTDQAEAIINRGRRMAALAVVDETLAQARRRQGDTAALLRLLLTIRGDLLVGTLRAAEAEANYREALALPAPPAVRTNILWRLAQSLSQRGQALEAVQLCQDAMTTIAPTDTLLFARLASVECQALSSVWRFDEAIQAGAQALSLADSLAHLTPHLADIIRARTHQPLSIACYYQCAYQAALDHSHQLVTVARRAGLRELEYTGLSSMGVLMLEYIGHTDLSLFYFERAEAGFEEIGYSYGLGNLLGFKAIAHYLRNEPEIAARVFHRAEEILRQIGDLEGLNNCQTDHGFLLLALGRVVEARALAERLATEHVGQQERWYTIYAMYLLGIMQMVEGQAEAALVTLRHTLALPQTVNFPIARIDLESALALALLVTGDMSGAQQILEATPLDELGIWLALNRQFVMGVMALARGDSPAAAAIAAAVAERANAAGYGLYSLSAARLAAAIQNPPPLADMPRLLWVNTPPADASVLVSS